MARCIECRYFEQTRFWEDGYCWKNEFDLHSNITSTVFCDYFEEIEENEENE